MNGHFLSPKNDVVFRLLFGDKRNGDLLCDFLKSVLTLPDDDFSEITIASHFMIRHRQLNLPISLKSIRWSFPNCPKRRIIQTS
jgi:hypothetical protein